MTGPTRAVERAAERAAERAGEPNVETPRRPRPGVSRTPGHFVRRGPLEARERAVAAGTGVAVGVAVGVLTAYLTGIWLARTLLPPGGGGGVQTLVRPRGRAPARAPGQRA